MSDGFQRGEGGGAFPPPTTARKAAGGIRPQGPLGASWWAQRWLAGIEAHARPDRLQQGRTYARGGQVLTLRIELGVITATVQGTRRAPYAVRIEVEVIEQRAWIDVAAALNARAHHRAQLSSGELPEQIEALFAALDLRLFPRYDEDLRLSCSCDDWARPCRHILATSYLVASMLDADPIELFRLRGIERELLLALLQASGSGADGDPEPELEPEPDLGAPDPVSAFWHGPIDLVDEPAVEPPPIDVRLPVVDAPLMRLLGPPPLWTGTDDFEPAMQRIHERISSDPRPFDLAVGPGDGP